MTIIHLPGARRIAAWILSSALFACPGAYAAVTGVWTPDGSASASASALGIAVLQSGNPGSGNYSAVNFAVNSTWWSNPYGGTVSGGAAVNFVITGTRNITVTFSEPVDNPILHVSRIGGTAGTSYNSSVWALSGFVAQGATVTMERLSGNAQFVLDAAGVAGFRRTTGGDGGLTSGQCGDAATTTGCGSIRFNGTGIASLSFAVNMRGGAGNGDGLDFLWSFAGSQVIVVKQSIDGTARFGFDGGNGVGDFELDTAVANPASSSAFAVGDHAAAIAIAETPAPGYALTSAACVDQRNAAVPSSLSGNSLSIAASAYGGNQTLTCTFVNTRQKQAALSILKSDGADGYTPGATASYVLKACNAADATVAADGAAIADAFPNGITLASPWTCTGSGGATCSAGSGGAVGDTRIDLLASALPAGGCLSIQCRCCTAPTRARTDAVARRSWDMPPCGSNCRCRPPRRSR